MASRPGRARRAGALLGAGAAAVTMLGACALPATRTGGAEAAPATLASTPPMGWNSWNRFGCGIDEATVRRQADAMVASGMAAAGYRYIVLDDCWQGARDANGHILPDPQRFPSGIAALADYVHARGLKFGLYSDAGRRTCERRPGSLGHEFDDAQQYAAWGVDYLKYDWCNTAGLDAPDAYRTMAQALRATQRPIVFSICEWGAHAPWRWAAAAGGNLWRTTADIDDLWQGENRADRKLGVLDIADRQVGLDGYAGPGHWNDPDMLEVGNGGMTPDEDRAHFSLWAMLAAPLIAGNDLTAMDDSTTAVLTNRAVIGIDQDARGAEARRLAHSDDSDVWARPLADGAVALLLLNRGSEPRTIGLDGVALPLPPDRPVEVQDLWNGQRWQQTVGQLSADLAPHAARLLRLTPTPPTGD